MPRRATPPLLALLLCFAPAACDPAADAARDHVRRGEAAMGEGRYVEAYTAFSHAKDLTPHDPAVQRGMMRARAYAIAEQPARMAPEILDDARYEAKVLADTDKPHEAVYLTTLANLLARQGDADGAREKLDAALRSDPSSVMAHTALGLLLAGRKETVAKAKGELEAALRTKPDHAPALVALAQIELGEGDAAGAATHLEAALKGGDDAPARVLLGSARVQQQRAAEGIEQFQRAAQLDPKNADALSGLGQALLSLGRADEAEQALRAAAQLRPDPAALTALGFALARQKKSSQALGVFGQVLEKDASSPPALLGAGVAAEDLGRKGQALDYYQRLLAIPAGSNPAVAGMRKEAETRVAAIVAGTARPAASASAAASALALPHP